MSKYDIDYQEDSINIKDLLTNNEQLLWTGKPKMNAFTLNKTLVMFPFAIIWLCFDGFALFNIFRFGDLFGSKLYLFIVPFFLIHLMPVWIWISNVLTAKRKWKNTTYAVTDKRIITTSGFVGFQYDSILYKDIDSVSLRVNFIDKLLGVGDIYFITKSGNRCFLDLEDCQALYIRFQKIVSDIQTDIQYPNNLRPESNDGYNTEYHENQQ